MTAPFVSVVIPAHDAAPWIAETVESVLAQRWERREVIVVDDGSTDDTAARVDAFGPRVTLLRQENAGGGAARNAGLRAARGDAIVFLDHDDLLEPRALERQVEVLRRRPESGFVACDGVQFDGERVLAGRLLHGPLARALDASSDGVRTCDAHGALLRGNAIATPGQVLLPRAVVEETGPFSTARDEPYDYDYWLRVALRRPVTLHRDALVRWRYRPASRSGLGALRRLRWALMDLPVLERHAAAVPAGRRRAVRAAIARRARRARLAWVHGRRHGMGEARSILRRLASAAPLSPWPRLWALATHVPAALVAPFAAREVAEARGDGDGRAASP